MSERMREDIQSVFHRDPAVRNALEVLTCYLGLHTIWPHRLVHDLWTSGWKWLARLVSNFGRWMTGTEIHLGTRIGWYFLIDHGMGIVAGETAEIGDDITLYQGVTLGGTTWSKSKRHPTFGNNMVVGAGAKVFGPFTVGEGVKVGSNAVMAEEAPPGATVVGIPGRIIMHEDTEQQAKCQAMAEKLSFDAYGVDQDTSDPVVRTIGQLLDHLRAIDGRFEGMCQAPTALGSDYCVKDLLVLHEEDSAGVKDEDGNPAA